MIRSLAFIFFSFTLILVLFCSLPRQREFWQLDGGTFPVTSYLIGLKGPGASSLGFLIKSLMTGTQEVCAEEKHRRTRLNRPPCDIRRPKDRRASSVTAYGHRKPKGQLTDDVRKTMDGHREGEKTLALILLRMLGLCKGIPGTHRHTTARFGKPDDRVWVFCT